ncbi:MAG: hypothetical protein CVV27_10720, partial [Candidatus Melainabacteria bacterium HGW-Melainabacteria-1]
LQDLNTSAELELIKGHALKAESKPVYGDGKALSWGAVKLGSSHQVYTGLSLSTSTQLDANGKPQKYGGGFKLDYGNGLNLEGEALAKADTNFSRPTQALDTLDLKFGFRYKQSF